MQFIVSFMYTVGQFFYENWGPQIGKNWRYPTMTIGTLEYISAGVHSHKGPEVVPA